MSQPIPGRIPFNGEAQITPVDAFGWRFHWVRAATGTWYDMLVARPSSVKACGVYSMYAKGLLHGVNLTTGQRMPDRVPGLLSCTLPDIDAGIYRYTAQEPSEWFCIDRRFNGGELPPVQSISIAAGQRHEGMVVVCTGPDAGQSFTGYTAPQACLAMALLHANPRA